MSGQIFISYRREESRWSARSLYDRLTARFDQQVFMDIDAIALGDDFVREIENRVGDCDVLIAMIGTDWLTSADEQNGRRLDNPEDFVRMEIATALRRDIRVIPVLVDGALMPRSTDLPDDLKALARRNALEISYNRFNPDFDRLVAAVEKALQKAEVERKKHEEKERLENQFFSCFICYSSLDKPFATRLHDALQSKGIRCWLDQKQLLPGHDIVRELERAIGLSDKFLLCASKNS
jgi:hypothetical protein